MIVIIIIIIIVIVVCNLLFFFRCNNKHDFIVLIDLVCIICYHASCKLIFNNFTLKIQTI